MHNIARVESLTHLLTQVVLTSNLRNLWMPPSGHSFDTSGGRLYIPLEFLSRLFPSLSRYETWIF